MEAAVAEMSWPVAIYTAVSVAFAVLFHVLFFWAIARGIKRRREQRNAFDPHEGQ